MSELTEVMEFLRGNVPTKTELAGLKTELAEFRQHADTRFDDLENRLDFSERVRLIERRLAKLEDAKPSRGNLGFQQ